MSASSKICMIRLEAAVNLSQRLCSAAVLCFMVVVVVVVYGLGL